MIKYVSNSYNRFEEKYPRLMKIGRYLMSGGAGAAVNIGLLFFLTHTLSLWYLLSSIISFVVATFVSFLSQKFWTFKDKLTDSVHIQAGLFISVALVNLAINTGIMYVCVEIISIHYILSQIIASLLIAVESYFIYRRIFPVRSVTQTVPHNVFQSKII